MQVRTEMRKNNTLTKSRQDAAGVCFQYSSARYYLSSPPGKAGWIIPIKLSFTGRNAKRAYIEIIPALAV